MDAQLADRPSRAGRPKSAPRPVPVPDEDYAHLSLAALRAYRRALQVEETKVSYWRRILQARLDVVRTGGSAVDGGHLAPVLTDFRVGAGRNALIVVLPTNDIPPLPALAELWERAVEPGDPASLAALEVDLTAAALQLSSYRAALHTRLGSATGQLIARYRADPAQCLSALPLPPSRRGT